MAPSLLRRNLGPLPVRAFIAAKNLSASAYLPVAVFRGVHASRGLPREAVGGVLQNRWGGCEGSHKDAGAGEAAIPLRQNARGL